MLEHECRDIVQLPLRSPPAASRCLELEAAEQVLDLEADRDLGRFVACPVRESSRDAADERLGRSRQAGVGGPVVGAAGEGGVVEGDLLGSSITTALPVRAARAYVTRYLRVRSDSGGSKRSDGGWVERAGTPMGQAQAAGDVPPGGSRKT